jgi:hypothetical protein
LLPTSYYCQSPGSYENFFEASPEKSSAASELYPLAALQHIEKCIQGLSAQGFDAVLERRVDAVLSDI